MHDKAQRREFPVGVSSITRCVVTALAFGVVAASCSDDSSDGNHGGNGGSGGAAAATIPAPGGLRKLTAKQYVASVRVLFGDAAADAARPPPNAQFEGSEAIAAAELPLTPAEVDAYERSATDVAAAALGDPSVGDELVACASGRSMHACFQDLAARVGRLAWRRPIDDVERAELVGVAMLGASTLGTRSDGVKAMLSAILQSPNFLYQVELGDPEAADDARRPLLPHELATRLSFFLLGQTPDEALLDLAEAGGLGTPEQIREVAVALVSTPRARAALGDFFAERFALDDVASIQKDPARYPLFTDATRAAIAEETRLFLDEVVWSEDGDALAMFDASFTFVNEDNAWIHGLSVTGPEFQKVVVPGRAGLLTQPSFLARTAHPGETSPTRRGKWVLEELLCQTVQPPPPGTNTVLPEPSEGHETMRERLENAIPEKTGCKVCHDRTDPIGLALEHFDAVGAHREDDLGLPIDAHGESMGLEPFDGAEELAASVRGAAGATRCLVVQLHRQSMGHKELDGERPAIDAIIERFSAGGHRLPELLVDIATSPAFTFVGAPK